MFFLQGYEGTTIDAIADRLKVTKPFIYSYYKNKGEILYDISRLGITVSLEALDTCLAAPGNHWDRLKLIIDRVSHLIFENEEALVVYLREEKNLAENRAREIRELRSLFDHRLAELLIAGNENGDFDVDNPSLTATTIGGMMSWVVLWYSPGGHWSETEVISNLLHNISRMVLPKKNSDTGGDTASAGRTMAQRRSKAPLRRAK